MQTVDENLLDTAQDPWSQWLPVSWEMNKELIAVWFSLSWIQNPTENMSNTIACKFVTLWNINS